MTTDPFEMMMRLKDPDEIFDLVCVANYMRGQLDGMVPVDESRQVFERIKELITAKALSKTKTKKREGRP